MVPFKVKTIFCLCVCSCMCECGGARGIQKTRSGVGTFYMATGSLAVCSLPRV